MRCVFPSLSITARKEIVESAERELIGVPPPPVVKFGVIAAVGLMSMDFGINVTWAFGIQLGEAKSHRLTQQLINLVPAG